LGPAEERWIRSLTRHSAHPHSARITAALAPGSPALPADSAGDDAVDGFRETPGGGIEGRIAGHAILLGSQSWLASRGVGIASGGGEPDGSLAHVAFDGHHRGAFVLTSAFRPEVEGAVRTLSERYDVALLSGDNERERGRFERLFGGGDRLHFNQSPLDKLGFIGALQRSGRTVMMVGDGLNDAGALRQSDAGVAVVEHLGAFSPACDVILEARQVARLPVILAFSRRSARVVRTAFSLSILYNLTGISIAAAGLLSPLISAVLMPASSISVVLLACGGATWAARRTGLAAGIPLTSGPEIPQPDAKPHV